MASKFFRGFSKVFKGPQHKGKVATIGGVKPKISTKKSDQIKRSNKLIRDLDKTMKKDMSPQMKKRGEKLKKEVKDTQKKVYRSKMAMGGVTGAIDKLKGKARGQQGQKRKPKFDPSDYKLPDGVIIVVPDGKGGTKQLVTPRAKKLFGGRIKKKKPETEKQKSIKEKILPKKKKDRLNELRKELGMKKGGKAKFPDLTGDGKVTRADILKGRGVFKKGGSTTFKDLKKKGVISDKVKVKEFNKLKKQFGFKKGGGVKQMVKTVTSPITHLRNKLKSRKFGRGKK